MRRALLAWSALVVPVWATLVYCCVNAPVVFDMWTPYLWHRETPANLHAAWAFAVENYRFNNPRLGHIATVGIALPPWSAIVMPLVTFALVYLAASFALGRLASLRRAGDALVALVLAGMIVACAPAIGPMLLYVPYTVNYVIGLVLALAFLLPYRLAPPTARWWYAPALVVLGAAAGMCNEHTAPAVGLLALAATVAFVRSQRRVPVWMVAGLVGFAAGAAALYLAPGQHFRYGGLATQHTALEIVASRGVGGALRLLASVARAVVWIVPFAAIAVVSHWRERGTGTDAGERRAPGQIRWREPVALVATAVLIVATLLGSPKLGERLLFAPVVLICIATTALIAPLLELRGARIAAGVLAAAILVYTGVRCVRAYRVLGPESDARLAVLTSAPRGSAVELHALSVPGSRFSIGDDFDDESHRSFIAGRLGLSAIRIVPAR